jgi:hypothetical protein
MSPIRALSAISTAVGLLGAAMLGFAPTASAEVITLDNKLIVDTTTEGAGGGRRIIVTIPDNFLSVSHINVRSTGHEQFEREVVNQVSSFIVNRDQVEVSVQACSTWGLFGGSDCNAFSTFRPYEAPAPPPPAQTAPERATVKYDSNIYDGPRGNIIGSVNGYLSPDGIAEFVELRSCQEDQWCQIGYGANFANSGWLRREILH